MSLVFLIFIYNMFIKRTVQFYLTEDEAYRMIDDIYNIPFILISIFQAP